ncbi:glycosyltransferase family 4 protein [Specibacter sp. NPDC057265]|uniref:glycosyltransferase family 4 protein n=1 Tax=Specibacter sp. NPDC057265 TaxID=3346075 RepID=UPI0036368157
MMSRAVSFPSNSILIIAPWLQGGGAQGALVNLMTLLPKEQITMVVLFKGNRNHHAIRALVSSYTELDFPKSILGVWHASRALKKYIEKNNTIYSLMRASHLVLGLISPRILAQKRLAATFHQLPSQDSEGVKGKVENILVRRGVRGAGLITAPSVRAIEELNEQNIGSFEVNKVEQNLISTSASHPKPPRDGVLTQPRLLFAGRLTEQKGLDRLGELLAETKVHVHVRCLGDGKERKRLHELSESISGHTIELFHHVEDITEHLDWADAVFLPSRWELNPLVIWEGRARGRATVGSSIEAFKDLSKSGPMLLFSNAAEFAEIIQNISEQSDLRNKLFHQALDSYKRVNTRSLIVQYLAG